MNYDVVTANISMAMHKAFYEDEVISPETVNLKFNNQIKDIYTNAYTGAAMTIDDLISRLTELRNRTDGNAKVAVYDTRQCEFVPVANISA